MSVKYLVSGGEGALGKTVISMLLQRGEKVRVLMSELSDTRIYRNNPNIEICYGISTDKDSMREFFELDDPRSAVLFHTDEYVSLSDSTNLTMRRVNVIGAENIVDMCLKRKVGKLVYLSSAYALNPEVSGDSITIHFDRNKVEGEYAKSKAEAAAYVMEKVALNRLNAVMVLPTFIIGPGYSEDYEINKVLNSYLNNGTIPPKGGGRAFVDVRDVANAMLTLADKGEAGAGYIVSGDYKTSGEFFQDVNDIQGIDAPVKTASKLVMSKSLAKLVDFYYKITHKENPREAYTLFSENPDARFEDNSNGILPETTISFKESLNDTIKGAQHGGIQAAAAVIPKSDKKFGDSAQGKAERKSSAEAMEARLKQTQNVTSKAASVSSAPSEAPMRPAHTRPVAAAAKAAEEQKEEASKSIISQSTLKDPENEIKKEDETKSNSETTFRFGGTPTKFTRAEAPQKSIIPKTEPKAPAAPAEPKSEPVKPIIPPSAPKAEPVKSIIPPSAPKASEEVKTEAPKAAPASSGFPRPGFARTAAPAAPATPKAEVPKAAEAPKAEAPKTEEAPKAEAPKAAPASSGFPRAGFPRAAATPSSVPAAPKTEAPKTAETPKAEAHKTEAPKAAPVSSGFPRAAATPSSAPAAPKAAAPKAEEPVKKPANANAIFNASMSGSGLGSGLGGSGLGSGLGSESSLGGETLHSDSSTQSANYAFMAAQAEQKQFRPVQPAGSNPFKAAPSNEPSPFKASQSNDSNPFKAAQSNDSGPFKSSQPAASAPKTDFSTPINSAFKPAGSGSSVQNTVPSGPINSAFKSAEPATAPKAEPVIKKEPAPFTFSETDLSDLEDEIDKFGIPEGPVVPPGIFAPPPKSGRD